MDNFFSLGYVDVKPLMEALAQREDLWNQNPERLDGFNLVAPTKFDDIWVHMPLSLKSQNLSREQIMSNLFEIAQANRWHQCYYELPFKPILTQVFASVDAEAYGRVIITRLNPGQNLFPHVDQDNLSFARFHVSLQSAPGQDFICGGEKFTPVAGEVFWFDNGIEHSVENNSEIDRITLIVDLITPHYNHFKTRGFNVKEQP